MERTPRCDLATCHVEEQTDPVDASIIPRGPSSTSPLSSFPTACEERGKAVEVEIMAALANSLIPARDLRLQSLSGFSLKLSDQSLLHCSPMNLSPTPILQRKAKVATSKSQFTIRAGYRDSGRPSSAGIFVGGFVLGGIIVGTLGCVYAPQISKALTGADRKDLMRKLPKFIYDEEKALEKTRRILAEKIAQLNSAIDDVSSQLRADDAPNGVADVPNGAAVVSDEVEAAM